MKISETTIAKNVLYPAVGAAYSAGVGALTCRMIGVGTASLGAIYGATFALITSFVNRITKPLFKKMRDRDRSPANNHLIKFIQVITHYPIALLGSIVLTRAAGFHLTALKAFQIFAVAIPLGLSLALLSMPIMAITGFAVIGPD